MAFSAPHGGGAMAAFRLEEALANHNHASIFATVNIGTPPQALRLLLDTSAGASWLFGENCSACARRRCLSTRRSSSARETNRSFSLRLRSGAGLEGHIVNESFAIGALRAVGQPIAVVDRWSGAEVLAPSDPRAPPECTALPNVLQPCQLRRGSGVLPGAFDGVLGLGLSSRAGRAPGEPASVLDALLEQNRVADDVFALRASPHSGGGGGALHLGGYSARAHRGELRWHNCTSPRYWQLALDAVHVEAVAGGGRYAQPSCAGAGCEALLDSGSAFITGPVADVEPLLLALGVAADCSGVEELPTLTFRAGGRDWALGPSEHVLRVRTARGVRCASALVPHADPKATAWVLGAPFFRRHYAVFDRARHRIGLAEQRLHEAGTVAAAAAAAPRRADQWLAARDATSARIRAFFEGAAAQAQHSFEG